MTTAQYMRAHLNAPPSKLRSFIKNQIFAHDDVTYLKKLVKDIGGFDYVFRFLWYDGPVPAADDTSSASASVCVAAGLTDGTEESSIGSNPCCETKNKRVGRTWIQYCCYWNAHKCLLWIFDEIIRNHLQKQKNYNLRQQMSMTSMDQWQQPRSQQSNTVISEEPDEGVVEEQPFHIIQQLLQFPSISYCATHYVAVAALRNAHNCLSLLLTYGRIDPNVTINNYGTTAAHLSAWKNHIDCLSVLQQPGSGNIVTEDDALLEEPPAKAFVTSSEPNIGKQNTFETDWNIVNAKGDTALHIAAREGHKETMKFFLNLATESALKKEVNSDVIDFSIRNDDGMDCIAVAAMNDHAEIISMVSESIDYLSEELADDIVGEEANRDTPAKQFTLPQSPSMHQKQKSIQTTPNRRRVQSEPYNNLAEFLLASVKKDTPKPLHRGTKKILPKHFPSLNNPNSLPLHVAIRHGNCNTIEALFESNHCDTTARDSQGQTGLHVAASENQIDACQMLVYLSSGDFQEFDVVDGLGRTPLYIACSNGSTSLARILISVSNWRVLCNERKKTADGSYVNVAHQPPFHAAVVNNHLETVRVLLDAGVDVDQTDIDGRTAISAAAKLGLYDMCQLLISYDADVNKRSSRGGPTPFQKVSMLCALLFVL
jgi:ankyrin repeat protein